MKDEDFQREVLELLSKITTDVKDLQEELMALWEEWQEAK